MKNILYITFVFLLISCNKEDAGDCFQTTGDIIQKEFTVDTFDKIVVHKGVELIIEEGATQKVVIETGENLLSDISVEVINSEIIVRDNNGCNYFRDYGITKVYITSPNITTIRNASEQNVTSKGVLTYPSLYLRSSGEKEKFLSLGDWHLNIQNESVRIWSNGLAIFNITGTTSNLDLNFSDGDTRFEGQNFKAKNINIKQVSSNDMLIYPVESLTGSIHSTGDVFSYNKPPVVTVDEQSVGKLIFK